jgi:hypothetical protein
MKGLRHIKGKTASQLVGLLRKSGIKFDTNCPPRSELPRDSWISVEEDNAREILGEPDKYIIKSSRDGLRSGTAHYFSYYELSSSFNVKKLEGDLRFERGTLVVTTRVCYPSHS